MTIDSNTVSTVTEVWDYVKTTLILETQDALSTLKVDLSFVYSDSQWVYKLKSVEFVSAITKNDGDPTIARSTLLKSLHNPCDYFIFKSVTCLVQTKIQADRNKGEALYFFESTSRMLDTENIISQSIKAHYVYPNGWQYDTIEGDWNSIQTTDVSGDYELDTMAGLIGTMRLDGKMVMMTKSDETVTFSNTISGTLIKDGKSYSISAEPCFDENYTEGEKKSYYIRLNFGSGSNEYVLLLVEDGLGHGGEASDPYWYGIVGDNDQAWINFLD